MVCFTEGMSPSKLVHMNPHTWIKTQTIPPTQALLIVQKQRQCFCLISLDSSIEIVKAGLLRLLVSQTHWSDLHVLKYLPPTILAKIPADSLSSRKRDLQAQNTRRAVINSSIAYTQNRVPNRYPFKDAFLTFGYDRLDRLFSGLLLLPPLPKSSFAVSSGLFHPFSSNRMPISLEMS